MLCILRGLLKSLFPFGELPFKEIPLLQIAQHFSPFRHHIYLDHNATTPLGTNVRRIMNRVLTRRYGNPSSLYALGRESSEIIEEARLQVARAMNAHANEIFFTGSATESNNMILKSLSAYFFPRKNKIISTPIEHPSVLHTLEFLATQGIEISYCPVDKQGRVQLHELESLIDDNTFLICCMLANNEIGTIQDLRTVSAIAKKHTVLVMSDCVQAFGKIPIDIHSTDCDYASFSAHKLYGPKGVGALYVKHGSPIFPFLHGGHQESGLRAGTESVHNIAGFGAACENISRHLQYSEQIRKRALWFSEKLKSHKADCVINSPMENCLPNTLNITFPNCKNAALMAVFDDAGIAVSAGSACSSHDNKPSHVLHAIGLTEKETRETIRFSLGHQITMKDLHYTIRVFRNFLEGKTQPVTVVSSSQVNKTVVFDSATFILDVRPQFLRKKEMSLPNAHEIAFMSIDKYLPCIPKDKNILVVCQHGNLSYIMAYYLLSKGFEHVSTLQGGIQGWKARYSDLYEKYAGHNVTILQPAGKVKMARKTFTKTSAGTRRHPE